jgi:hypothetical protein
MEMAMTYQDRDPPGGRMSPVEPRRRAEPSERVGARQALWSCAVAAAVVVVLGIVFYRINAVDHPQTAAHPAPTATSPQTTGQGGAPSANQPAGNAR